MIPRLFYCRLYCYQVRKGGHYTVKRRVFLILKKKQIIVSSIVWSIVYDLSVYGTLKTLVSMVLVEFLLVGSVISTFTWYVIDNI